RHTRLQGDWSSDVCSSDLSALSAGSNAAGGANDLFGDKALRPERRVMVEEDPIGSKQTIGLAIVDHRPVCGCFGQAVWTARVKRDRKSTRLNSSHLVISYA